MLLRVTSTLTISECSTSFAALAQALRARSTAEVREALMTLKACDASGTEQEKSFMLCAPILDVDPPDRQAVDLLSWRFRLCQTLMVLSPQVLSAGRRKDERS